jgi:hypothetical protein
MKTRPILFQGPMVRAILDGTKTQTRRIVKPQPLTWATGSAFLPLETLVKRPFGNQGDRLWVREMFGFNPDDGGVVFRATDPDWETCDGWKWKPSIFMPRKFSRITLEITAIRVERLQKISEADAKAEGVETKPYGGAASFCTRDYSYNKQPDGFWPRLCIADGKQFRDSYKTLWESINGPGSWGDNPWVWCVEFRRVV